MDKKDRKELFKLFVQVFSGCNFNVISGLNPCIVMYNGVRYNVYIKNLTPAQLSNNNPDVWRCQLPKRPIFDDFKKSPDMFILLGYDATNDVYATWNPYWAKQRLNVGESVSMYSRYSVQTQAANEDTIKEYMLNHDNKVIVFPRMRLTEYISKIKDFFPEETNYNAVGSSLRKTTNNSLKKEEKDNGGETIVIKQPNIENTKTTPQIKPNILTPDLIVKLKPLMCQFPSLELEALQVLYQKFGDKYNDTMTINDWLELLNSYNWYMVQPTEA